MTEPPGGLAVEEADLGRVLTWPNAITVLRLCAIPVYVWLLFTTAHELAAGFLLGTLGVTDWVDGFVARRLHQVTTLGKVLDPIADRALVFTAVVTVALHGAVPWWFAGLSIARELVVSLAVVGLAAAGAARIDVLWIGKAGTFGLLTAYPLLLMAHGPQGWQSVLHEVAWLIGWVGLMLAWFAAFAYLRPARDALVRGRHGRELG